jgi:3-oxoadipate enol-lactonase
MRNGTALGANRTALAYQMHGPSDAPPILLLQGQANSHHWWDGIREGFAAEFCTITFDYRGTGASPTGETSAGAWSTSSFAADAVAVLDELGCERVHVYGTSMGGRVAQMLAIEHGERVDRLVLACSSPGGPHAHERSPAVRRSLGQADPAARRQSLLELMYTPSWFRSPMAGSNLLGDPGVSTTAARLHLQTSDRHNALDRLHTIRAAVLVLHGSDDDMVPAANAHLIAERIPGARLEIIEGARHGFFDEFADEITPRVKAFLQQGAPQPLCRRPAHR